MLEVESGNAHAIVEPELGGSLLAFSVGGVEITRRAQSGSDPRETSSFPMVPWVNRIDRGKFATSDHVHSIRPNTEEPHPLHGHGWQRAWSVDDLDSDRVTLRYDHTEDSWPWPYTAFLRYLVEPDRLIVDMEVTNRSETSSMPAALGFHPYFERPARISATVDGRWEVGPDLIPTAWTETDGFRLTDVDGIDADNTYTGWDGRAFIELSTARVELVADVKRLHLYAPRWAHFFALEPVSASPDAVNHAGRGSVLLEPGGTLHHWMRLVVDTA
jgi:aldose 1-epimerase